MNDFGSPGPIRVRENMIKITVMGHEIEATRIMNQEGDECWDVEIVRPDGRTIRAEFERHSSGLFPWNDLDNGRLSLDPMALSAIASALSKEIEAR